MFKESSTGREQLDIADSFSLDANGRADFVDVFQVFEITGTGDIFTGPVFAI